jgi:hypothetical protein
MIGRALFAFVWLLIGAGLLLPAYRAPVPAPAVPFVARMASNVAAADVEGASPACPPACSCAYLVVAAPDDADLFVRVSVGWLIWAAPAEAKPMTSRLPSI